jgi:hypothetical protein
MSQTLLHPILTTETHNFPRLGYDEREREKERLNMCVRERETKRG